MTVFTRPPAALAEIKEKRQATNAIGELAVTALRLEASLPLKPGLVSPRERGAHHDMDYGLMLRSAEALQPCFSACATAGYEFQENNREDLASLMDRLRPIGLDGERAMYAATGGVNTHKGAIFCLGIASAAIGHLAGRQNFAIGTGLFVPLRSIMRSIAKGIGHDRAEAPSSGTAGMRLYSQLGVRGARGQAEDAYPIVFSGMLPLLERRSPRWPALTNALLTSIASLDDTCILSRGGSRGLAFMQENARNILWMGGVEQKEGYAALKTFASEATKRGLSPGGSADMLALSIFLHSLIHPVASPTEKSPFHFEEWIDE